jgi:hypothetical protein
MRPNTFAVGGHPQAMSAMLLHAWFAYFKCKVFSGIEQTMRHCVCAGADIALTAIGLCCRVLLCLPAGLRQRCTEQCAGCRFSH